MVKLEELKTGYLYKINARNASYGIWVEYQFIISRWTVGENYLFGEIHVDLSEDFGTATPLEEIEKSPFPVKRFDGDVEITNDKDIIDYLNSFK